MADNTKILPCNCESKFQDELYGKGKRLYNVSQGKKKNEAKCTVCGNKKVL